jgi:tRNA (guanine37-N1)-methyltransferase
MKINILTLFPEMFVAITQSSILGKAAENGLLDITLTNIRDFTLDKHKRVDDYPFGGGYGMVLTTEPVFRALENIDAQNKKCIYMSPRGKVLDYPKVKQLAEEEDLVILCGHYEGVDERILQYWGMEEISIGDYILTGGELPAMVLIDAVARMIPDVIGGDNSAHEESIYSGLLEYPQYTKPREYKNMQVPEVLVSGNHELIHLWKFEQSLILTKEKRPDLFELFLRESENLSKKEKEVLNKVIT